MLHVVVHDSVKKIIFVAIGSYPEGEDLKIYSRGEQILGTRVSSRGPRTAMRIVIKM